jgi:flagellin
VFIGGGRGASSSAVVANGSLSVDLSASTVDTKGLGLSNYKVAGVSTSDISSTSATSVSAILAQTRNGATGSTSFVISGAGFSDSNKITLSVNTSAVTDTDSLTTAINNAITAAGAAAGAPAAAFKAAGITASIITDSQGHQQLTFSSSKGAFQAAAGDKFANALLGNFRDAANAVGLASTPEVVSTGAWTDPGANQTLAITVTSKNTGTAVTSAGINWSGKTNVTDVAAAINGDATIAAVITASVDNGKLVITSDSGDNQTFAVGAGALATFMGGTSVDTASVATLNSGGVQRSTQAQSSAAFTYVGLGSGHTQSVTLGVTRSDGSLYSAAINLTNANAATIDNAVSAINSAIQSVSDPTFKSIVAVKEYLSNGKEGIRFMSSNTFNVTLGTQANSEGIRDTGGGSVYGTQLASSASSGGGIADVASETNAKLAVNTLSAAVTSLSLAQATVGKGQNQFSYAISLASTQVTNLAMSESRIRDADLAAEAANLTKAQILQQAGIAALAQANSAPQAVLSLLKG